MPRMLLVWFLWRWATSGFASQSDISLFVYLSVIHTFHTLLRRKKKIAMFPPLQVAERNLTRAAGIAFFFVFFWNKNNVLQFTEGNHPIVRECSIRLSGHIRDKGKTFYRLSCAARERWTMIHCLLRFPDISTSLISHAGVNSAENKRGI